MVKKTILLITVAALAIAIDGTLTHDIFDYRVDSFFKWATIILIVVIVFAISWPKNIKDKEIKNNLNKK